MTKMIVRRVGNRYEVHVLSRQGRGLYQVWRPGVIDPIERMEGQELGPPSFRVDSIEGMDLDQQAPDYKSELLKHYGYTYSLSLELYANKEVRRVFSSNYVDAATKADMLTALCEPSGSEWRFYFTSELPPGVKAELVRLLGGD